MKLAAATAACLLVILSSTIVAQDSRRDGNWQVTLEMEVPGMPQKMPPMTMTQCLTKEEAKDPTKLAPQGGRGAMPSNCKVTDFKEQGNKVTWSMKCEGDNAMSGTGEFVYKGATYVGTMTMNTARGGQPMTMTMRYTGKRLGDCEK